MSSAVIAKAAVLGGTVMAGKGTAVAVTTVISIAMFAVGVGGGVAIQAARETSAAVVESTPNSPEPRTVTTDLDSKQVESLRQLVEAQEVRIRELRAAGPDASTPELAAPTPQDLQVKSARVADLWLRSYRQSLSKEEEAEMLKLYAEIDATWAPYLIDIYRKVAGDPPSNRSGMLVLLFCEAGGPEVARFVADRLKDESCSESERRSLQSHLADPTASYRVLDKTPTTPELALLAQSWITASEPHVRAAGARLLGGVDSADSRAVLTGLLVDANWSTRCAAILALGRAGDAASLSDLMEFRRSRDGTWPDSNEGRAERKAVDRAIRKLQSRLER